MDDHTHRFVPMIRFHPDFVPSREARRFARAVYFKPDEVMAADVCAECGAVKKLASGEILPPLEQHL